MDSIQIIQLLIDFGLVVLIWLVQLVIYPSFLHYEQHNLLQWHKKYTIRITFVVLPLMVGQLLVVLAIAFEAFSLYNMFILLVVILIWLNTFLQAVPLHQKIDNNFQAIESAGKLIRINWIRTTLWSLIFIGNTLKMFVL